MSGELLLNLRLVGEQQESVMMGGFDKRDGQEHTLYPSTCLMVTMWPDSNQTVKFNSNHPIYRQRESWHILVQMAHCQNPTDSMDNKGRVSSRNLIHAARVHESTASDQCYTFRSHFDLASRLIG
jgi:hypothetical protein